MKKRALLFGAAVVVGVSASCGGGDDNGATVQGGAGEACYANGTCNPGLSCVNAVCADGGGGPDASLESGINDAGGGNKDAGADAGPALCIGVPVATGTALRLVTLTTATSNPTAVTAPALDFDRLFVAERAGKIRIFQSNAFLTMPFLDVTPAVVSGSEQGLLSVVFHPQYATNGRFFIAYSAANSGDASVNPFEIEIWEYARSSADPNLADPASGHLILAIPHDSTTNNGGSLAFGKDGMLYFSSGDLGNISDAIDVGEDKTQLAGKILRLDVDHGAPYQVPPDNPFVGTAGVMHEIWDYGFRAASLTIDPRSGDLYITDPGGGSAPFDEVDYERFAAGGHDYGWSAMAGNGHCYNNPSCNTLGIALPVTEYNVSAGGCKISGGGLYTGCRIPSLQGTYFYADICSGAVTSFRIASGAATGITAQSSLAPSGAVQGFGNDARGELYLITSTTIYSFDAQ